MIQINIVVSKDLADILHNRRRSSAASRAIDRIVEDNAYLLKAVHPEVKDPQLACYFTVEVDDSSPLEKVMTNLRKITAVEAAYIKPADEIP